MNLQGFGKGKYDKLIGAIVAVLIIVMIITVYRNYRANNTLELYDESNVIETVTDETDMSADIESTIYTYPVGFSIRIPSDWTRVTKSGYDTYVHSPTGSSIQIQVLEYDPAINNVNAQDESVTVTEKGMTFVSFTRTTTSSYELMYQDYQNATYDYIEEVYWDREYIVKLICTFNDQYYSDIIEYYEFILNSFAWNKSSPIPEDLVLWYFETGDFEFAYPLGWSVGTADNAVVAMNESGTAYMTVMLSEYAYPLSDVTGTELASMIGTGRSNYMLNWYDSTSTTAIADSTYVSGNVQYTNRTYLFANGLYLYTISFDYEAGMIDDSLPDTCVSLFREFLSDKITEAGRAAEEAAEAEAAAEVKDTGDADEAGADTEMYISEEEYEGYTDNADYGLDPDDIAEEDRD